MKDELHGEIMRQMVGLSLRSKMYATDVEGDEQREKKDKLNAKKSKSVERDITFEDYKDCLFIYHIIP